MSELLGHSPVSRLYVHRRFAGGETVLVGQLAQNRRGDQWGKVAISLGVRKKTRTMVASHLDRLLKENRALLARS